MDLIKLMVSPAALPGSFVLIIACSSGLCFSVPQGVAVPPSLRNVSRADWDQPSGTSVSTNMPDIGRSTLKSKRSTQRSTRPSMGTYEAQLRACIMSGTHLTDRYLTLPFSVGTSLHGPRTGFSSSTRPSPLGRARQAPILARGGNHSQTK